jgi:signal transduction histidine kinase
LLRTVETALRITRAEAGIGRDAFAPVDLKVELEEIAEIYGPLVEDADRAIRVVAPVELTLPVHRELLAQALGNLVDNALKYGAGTITLALDVAPGMARVSVADEGPGMPPEHRDTALRRFGRVDEARGGSGAGLGLSLVTAVARLHGGTVVLEHDAGLKVVMELPV